MAAASPPLEPPGVRDGSQGLRVAPLRSLSVWKRNPKSGRLVRPIGIAPAFLRWATTGASVSGRESFRPTIPCVVAEPTRSMFSLIVMGTPCSGPTSSPEAIFSSASRAARKASSSRTTVTAFTPWFTASMRSRCARITSSLDTFLSRMALAKLVALHRHKGSCAIALMIFVSTRRGIGPPDFGA